MTPEEQDECFDFVHKLVLKCGDVLREGFANTGVVTNKGDAHDLVTFWDGEIEKIIINGIKEKYPNHKFIAEEDSFASGQKGLTSDPTWIIDPIDGTINFVNKLHFVCIAVALAIDEDLKFSFLYNPILNELYTARKGQGAFLNGKKIEASRNENLGRCLLAHEVSLGTLEAFRPKLIERSRALLSRCIGLRALGSAALTLGYVANGTIDAYSIEDLKPWDIAAGALIVEEAGGVVIDISGGKYDIMKPNVIAAGNMKIANEIKEILDEVDARLKAEGQWPQQLMQKMKK